MPWVIEKVVRRFHAWRLGAQPTITTQTIGLPTTVQVVARVLRARQRPFLLVTPDVGAHDEQLHWCVLAHAVVDALEPVVIPAQLHALKINGKRLRHDTKSHITTNAAERQAVLPGTNHQVLVLACFWSLTVAAHAQVVANGAAQEDVIPPTYVQGWDRDLVVLRFDAPLLPVGVIAGVLQPIIVIGRQIVLLQYGQVVQRERVKGAAHIVDEPDIRLPESRRKLLSGLHALYERRKGEIAQSPAGIKAQFEGTALIGPALVIVRGRDDRHNGSEGWRGRDRRQPLRGADV